MTYRKTILLAGMFLLATITAPATVSADIILYNNGKVLECLIQSETNESYNVWIVTESGIESEYSIPKSDVKEVEKKAYWGKEYKELMSSTNFQDEESVKALAEWCSKRNLTELAGKHSAEAEELHTRGIIQKYPEVACEPCGASGVIVCKACEGKGYLSEKCAKCKGEGRIKCDTCKGEKKLNCKKCAGKGTITVKKTSAGSSGGKSSKQACDKCRGTGKIRCSDCLSKGTVKCPDCKGSGKEKKDCKDCQGNPSTTCTVCKGKGIDPEKFSALQARLEREKNQTPEAVKPKDKPDQAEIEEAAKKKLQDRTRYINSYQMGRDGEITDEFVKEKIFVYPSLPVPQKNDDLPVVADNIKVMIVEDDTEAHDGGDGQQYYHIMVEGTKLNGYVAAKNLRTKKFIFMECPPCEGKGDFECPACHGENSIKIGDKEFPCMVCKGKKSITCIHCYGSGKLRKK